MRKYLASSLMKKLVVLIFFVIFFLFVLKIFSFNAASSSTQYYAVFLTNGQVYFGHINTLDTQVLTLSNVYYLRANTNLQNTQSIDDKKEASVDLALIKLGNELHGPKDKMMINRTNILFWEELREDGRVVQAIYRDKP